MKNVLKYCVLASVFYGGLSPAIAAQDCAHGDALDCYTQAIQKLQQAQSALDNARQDILALRNEIARVDKPGMVVPFAAATCPSPWVAYEPAEGRFVRGIDPNGKTDPDGIRPFGSTQNDGIISHQHQVGANGADSTTMVPGGATQRLAHFYNDAYGGGPPKFTAPNPGGLSETRPKNVALMYCILQ